MTNSLVGDIGGTNARFAIIDAHGAFLRVHECKTVQHRELTALLANVCSDLEVHEELEAAVIAVAGPVDGGTFSLTNADLRGNADELKKFARRSHILNDFQALAWGVAGHLRANYSSETILRVQTLAEPGLGAPSGVSVVLGAGTGLGMAHIVDGAGKNPRIIPGEGGHTTFAPESDAEWLLTSRMRKSLSLSFVTWEHLLSGSGLESIYAFIDDTVVELPASEITTSSTTNARAQRSVALFLALLARAARDTALRVKADRVYIAGGIAPKLLKLFSRQILVDGFRAHPSMQTVLAHAGLMLVVDPHPGLRGCATYASQL